MERIRVTKHYSLSHREPNPMLTSQSLGCNITDLDLKTEEFMDITDRVQCSFAETSRFLIRHKE